MVDDGFIFGYWETVRQDPDPMIGSDILHVLRATVHLCFPKHFTWVFCSCWSSGACLKAQLVAFRFRVLRNSANLYTSTYFL